MMMLQKKVLRCAAILSISILFLHFSPAILKASAANEPKQEDELNLLVQQFLLSEDEKQSEAFLKEILADPKATLTRLEEMIQNGQIYSPDAYVGSLHNEVQVGGKEMSYALYVPKDYDPALAYPLIVCLHGAGFNGDSYIDRWQSRLGEKSLLVCPSIMGGAWWSSEGEALVLAALEDVTSRYHIDAKRIFLTGMSNGGIGAYLLGMLHADRFSAISPMAGGIPDEIFPYLKNFSVTALYIIHGSSDQVMPVELSRKASEYMKKKGIPHVYREHGKEHPRAGGHFFPREELPALITWFNRQQRIADPAEVISVRDESHLLPFFWTEINETEGEVADLQRSLFEEKDVALVRSGAFPSVHAILDGNEITVSTHLVKKVTLFLNRRLIDFSKPLFITSNHQQRLEVNLTESIEFLLKEAKRRRDRTSLYSASVVIELIQ